MNVTLQKRIERAEHAAITLNRFAPECICFPLKEPFNFNWPIEEEIAVGVECPLHGERLRPAGIFIYVSKWLRDKREARLQSYSTQFRKAWDASFPPELWPAEEIECGDKVQLRLKDGSIVAEYPHVWPPKQKPS